MKNYKHEIEKIMSNFSPEIQDQIFFTYTLSKQALEGKFRENGHPFLEHPLNVVKILTEDIGLDAESVIAVFLHESIRFNPDILNSIPKNYFSDKVMEMAISLNKIAAINPKDTKLEADNYKKLIISYSTDPRVTIIKLADRLDVMRNIYLLPESSQKKKISETILLYIPIAHQLGLYNLKSELEQIYFSYSEPVQYRKICNKLKMTKNERENLISSFVEPLKKTLEEENIHAEIKSRTKAPYSIYKKLLKQDIKFEEIKDIFAIRVIIDCDKEEEKDLCWKVYSIVTSKNTPIAERLRDWLSHPKPNGYESLHTTVITPHNETIEVQIRSCRMDFVAENGHAAHWAYKGVKSSDLLSEWLNKVKEVMQSNEKSGYKHISRFLNEEVLVYTPVGELKRLKAGSCVLDYAFAIHTNLGLSCIGGKIDGKIVSIREKLKTGQTVEILRNKNQRKVNPDWLNFVTTSKARNKIKQNIKEGNSKTANIGKEMLDRRLKNWKLEFTDEDLALLCKKYKKTTINEFFAEIGNETIDLGDIKTYLTKKESLLTKQKNEKLETSKKYHSKDNDTDKPAESTDDSYGNHISLDGKLANVDYSFAKCCNPIYGDDVFGFVTIRKGIKIHKMSCPNAARLIEKYPYRIQKIKWKKEDNLHNLAITLNVIIDEAYVYQDTLDLMTELKVNLYKSKITKQRRKHELLFSVLLKIEIKDNEYLDNIMRELKKIKGVVSISKVRK
ncbi:MAG: HD domain-containing protein [Bacteroidales bacterium]